MRCARDRRAVQVTDLPAVASLPTSCETSVMSRAVLALAARREVWRRVTFERSAERWSYLTAEQRRERRASWPARRRAVRPVGLSIYWASVSWAIFAGDLSTPTNVGISIGWIVTMLPFAVIGFRDWCRDGKAETVQVTGSRAR